MRATSLDAVLPALEKLEAQPVPEAHWALVHCAQNLEYALAGYPGTAPWFFRTFLAPIGKRMFLARGEMKHPLEQPIPGAPEIARTGDAAQAAARLRKAIADFQAHAGSLHPHFAFGPLSRADAEKLHAMHIAQHLTPFGF